MPAGKQQLAGFSLVELLIVIALMGILAGIVLPQFQPNVPEHLQAVAQIVTADIENARQLAVSNGSTYRLTFDKTNGSYVLTHAGTNPQFNTLPPSPFRHPGDPLDQLTVKLGELPLPPPTVDIAGVQLAGSTPVAVNTLEFGPLGETVSVEDTVIWLGCATGRERRYLALTVDHFTGSVTIDGFTATTPALASGS